MRNELIVAIQGRKTVTFVYDGIAREAQPCAIGISRAGNEVLRCYQTAGGHVTPGHEWNFCQLSKIRNLAVTNKVFQGEPPRYRRGDKDMSQIFAEL